MLIYNIILIRDILKTYIHHTKISLISNDIETTKIRRRTLSFLHTLLSI